MCEDLKQKLTKFTLMKTLKFGKIVERKGSEIKWLKMDHSFTEESVAQVQGRPFWLLYYQRFILVSGAFYVCIQN